MFSKSFEYGIRAITYIATQSLEGKRVRIEEIAKKSDTPLAFTAKILRQLTKNNIISSKTGPNGGFYIEKEKMRAIRFSDIVDVIDGENVYMSCAFGLKECSNDNPCPMHERFKGVRKLLKETLTNTTILDLALGLKNGEGTLIQKSLGE